MPIWFGGTGNYDNGANWSSPSGVPAPGSFARIGSGTVEVRCLNISDVTLALEHGPGSAPFPVLDLTNAKVGSILLDSSTPSPHGSGGGTINVAGHVTFSGTIAPDQVDLSDLTINLAKHSTLRNTGTLTTAGAGTSASTDITGCHARVVNDGVIATSQGTTTIDPAVLGIGTIELLEPTGIPIDDVVTLGRAVGHGQTVLFSGTPETGAGAMLVLDDPHGFHGKIVGFGAGDTIELAHTTAGCDSFCHDVLTVRGPCGAVAHLRFADGFQQNDFSLSHSGGNTFITMPAHTA